MNKKMVAQEMLAFARELLGMEFDTKEEMEQYKKDHEVRPGTEMTVKKQEENKQPANEEAPAKKEEKEEKEEKKDTTTVKADKWEKHTDAWFDGASEQDSHDEPVKQMKEIVKKTGTKANLDKLHELAKQTKAPWGKKLSETIDAIKGGTFKGEFAYTYGGKPGGYDHVSQVSSLFNVLGQALRYNDKKEASELLKVAKAVLAIDFPTQDAMDKYLKDHPDADRSNHKVVEDDWDRTEEEGEDVIQQDMSK